MSLHDLGKPVVVVKIGGKAAEEDAVLRELALDLKDLQQIGRYPLLVHGGGAELSRISRELGIEPVFHEGVRVTSPASSVARSMASTVTIWPRAVSARAVRTARRSAPPLSPGG